MHNTANKKEKKTYKKGGGRKCEKYLNIFSTNAAGLKSKLHSFKSELKSVDASIFTVHETHFKKKDP